jgi:pyrroloquinoline quinone biosynthesis protein D
VTERQTVQPATVFRRRDEARMRKYRGRLFVAVAQRTVELEGVAEAVFRRVDGRASVADIARRLADHYDMPIADAAADTIRLLAELAAFGVIEAIE